MIEYIANCLVLEGMPIIYLDKLGKYVAETLKVIHSELTLENVEVMDPVTFTNHVAPYAETTVDEVTIIGGTPQTDPHVLLRLLNSLRALSITPSLILVHERVYEKLSGAKVQGIELLKESARVLEGDSYHELAYISLKTYVQLILRDKKERSPRLEMFLSDFLEIESISDPLGDVGEQLKPVVGSDSTLIVTPSTKLFGKVLEMETTKSVVEYYECSSITSGNYDLLTVTAEEHWVRHCYTGASNVVSINVDPLIASFYLLKIYKLLKQIESSSE